MKITVKIICFAAAFALCISPLGCSGGDVEFDIESFSYADDISAQNTDDPNVITDGFKNIKESEAENEGDAIELAEKEVKVDYNTIKVSFDGEKDIWRIVFYTENHDTGRQTVYLTTRGITVRTVIDEQ